VCIAGAWADVSAEMAPHLGGGNIGDVLVKFNSTFVKQPNGGAATPWHQDNGLWRDGNTDCFSIWMALEAATQANGCMQFVRARLNSRAALITRVTQTAVTPAADPWLAPTRAPGGGHCRARAL
jgi:hypothetical protein